MTGSSLEALFGLEGKTGLVTGAGRGIGRALARALAGAGATVACADLDALSAEETAKMIEADGGRAIALKMDCTEEGSIIGGMAQAARDLGRLDVLVNNAGTYPYYTLEDMSLDLFEQVYRLNVMGTFLCMREGVKAMRASEDGGSIINLGSVSAFIAGQPGLAAYGSSKAAIVQLTRNAALEFGQYGITVNAIVPGPIKTEGTQFLFDAGLTELIMQRQVIKRVGMPEDLAGIVIALASRAGRFITGAAIVIDGGSLVT